MMKNAAIVCLAIYFLGLASQVYGKSSYESNESQSIPENSLYSSAVENGGRNAPELSDDINNYDKRAERYAFGLGRRAYTYTNGNGVKRLPVYNFGLGKRARSYSFGLGKRVYDMDDENELDLELQRYLDGKRNRPYSFGLGKRENIGRSQATFDRYGFGLGR